MSEVKRRRGGSLKRVCEEVPSHRRPFEVMEQSVSASPERTEEAGKQCEEETSCCLLCMDILDSSTQASLPCCSFQVCRRCAAKWLSTCIREGMPARCPSGTCVAFTAAQLDDAALLNAEELSKAKRIVAERLEFDNRPRSERWILRYPSNLSLASAKHILWTLLHCRLCPGCRVQCVKEGGCNHVECTMCGCHFCWQCGRSRCDGCRSLAQKLRLASQAVLAVATILVFSLWKTALPAVAWLSVSVAAASTLACFILSLQITSSLLGDFLVSILPWVSTDEFRVRWFRERRKSARGAWWVSAGMTIPVGACASAWHRAVTGEWDVLCVSLTTCCVLAWVGLLSVMSWWDALQLLLAAYKPCVDADDILHEVAGPGMDSGGEPILPGDALSMSHLPDTNADEWYERQTKGTASGRALGNSRPPRRVDIIGTGLLAVASTTAYAYAIASVAASAIPAVLCRSIAFALSAAVTVAQASPPYLATVAVLSLSAWLDAFTLLLLVKTYKWHITQNSLRHTVKRLREQVERGLAVVGPCGLGDDDDDDDDNQGIIHAARGKWVKLLASFAPPLLLCFVTWTLGMVAVSSLFGYFWPGSVPSIALGWQRGG